jgi:hypothetical protein
MPLYQAAGLRGPLVRPRRSPNMGYAVHDLRELLSLARLLRRFAEEHSRDTTHALFLDTAVSLEARAHFLATAHDVSGLEQDTALHAPVNMVV